VTLGPVADLSGFVHEMAVPATAADMLEFVTSFARDGVAAGEPTLLAVHSETAETVRDAVGPSPFVTVLPTIGRSGRPASDLRVPAALLAEYGAAAARVRLLNQVPAVATKQWSEWRRLEAVINVALAGRPAWVVCVYDRATLTDEQAEDLYATHPVVRAGDQDLLHDRYVDPVQFAAARRDAPPDPVEQTVPSVELIDPSPAAARATVTRLTQHSGLPVSEVEGLLLAASEAVANAIVHGQPPVVLRLWAHPDRVTVTVTDTGTGPADPFVGLLPTDRAGDGGLGLWISHQLVDVAHRRHSGGYTIRLTAARPRTAGPDDPITAF
jgi:anti-sigma regulatory factor (Ser/Thr protein kinase)